MAAAPPTVDVVIPTWNRRDLVLGALESLRHQSLTHQAFVVDNGSGDGTVEAVRDRFPEAHVLALPENVGFARAVNQGIAAGEGDVVVVLNNDVVLERGFLFEITRPFDRDEVGAVAGILLSADGRAVDAAGVILDASLAGYSHLHGSPLARLEHSVPATVPCGGAAAYRRTDLAAVGAFDEEIFAYSEDVDLGLRLLARGVVVTTAWNARVRHLGSATLGRRSSRQLRLSAWSRGYLLGRYRVPLRLVGLELLVGLVDAVTVRSAVPVTRRIAGLLHGVRRPRRATPVIGRISMVEGLGLRWTASRRAPTPDRPLRVAVENGHDRDLATWRHEYDEGLRPDATPYGLDRLSRHGVDVTILGADRRAARLPRMVAAATLARVRVDPIAVFRDRGFDVLVTEHEKHSIAPLLVSRLRRGPKILTGVVWLTDVDVDVAPQLQRVLRWALAQAAGIFVHSPGQLPVLRAWGIPRERLFLAPFGVDVDFWKPAANLVRPGAVVSAGSDRHRDYPLLLDAFAMLNRPDCRLTIAGVPPMRGQAGVVYAGTLSHATLLERYRQAAIVVVPTRDNLHCSGLTSTLEAMACGRPVIVNDNPGICDYVEHGVTGLIVPPGDAAALAGAVGDLLKAPEEAEAMGRRARARVLEEFSTERFAERLADIVKAVA